MSHTEYSHQELREAICKVGYMLWSRTMVAANDGNITAKVDDNHILSTPTGVSKGQLTPDKLIVMNLDGDIVEPAPSGIHKPTSEVKMHLRMYRVNPDIKACVHAHPLHGTAFAIKGEALTKKMMPESVIAMPEIPLAPYGTPSTEAVPDSVEPFAFTHKVALLEQHGALSWGSDVWDAYFQMERLEYTAQLTFLTRLINGERELPADEIEKLIGMRAQYGL
ncbi:class II aldolase/adducin family protein [Corynebacterium meridianum]|uniref:Class II aldolase/adducin family protein n=1 Tax=Corynebacterium meridianum TaxID=2765363 RepID=A0A934I725_9CORY|nr:class II aldolase/adducin family protein [Corynebacterium meridianum]MBI8989514.1 class II aldolase/adducin family protein [Corynebacterium meridianum]MCK7677409.1 class II aldolase/adducin family protein [Corynebacterium meridianum]